MVYKRYIKRGGKTYGPYLYESHRVNGKVVASYVGEAKIPNRKLSSLKIILPCLFIVFFVTLLFFLSNNSITGHMSMQVNEDSISLFLKEGELLPKNAIISVTDPNSTREFLISDLISQNSESGSYYIVDRPISGFGEGYGFAGEKKVSSKVNFKLRIIGSQESQTGAGSDSNVADSSENSDGEASSENQPEETQNSGYGSDSDSAITGNAIRGITGRVIDEQIIDASASYNSSYNYVLINGQTAELVSGSVTDENGNSLGDSYVKILKDENILTVTTDYFRTEKGFGAEYIGSELHEIKIDISKMNLSSLEDSLFELEYNDVVLVSNGNENLANQNISAVNSTNTNETNVTELIETVNMTKGISLTKQIPDITLINGSFSISLLDYFSGDILNYSFFGDGNVSASFENGSVIFYSVENFIGNSSGIITAFNENESLESNLFSIISSYDNVSIQTIQYGAVIGKPVKWKKIIKKTTSENLTVELPSSATNVIISNLEFSNSGSNISENINDSGNLISGNAISIQRQNGFLSRLFEKVLSFTGLVTDSSSDSSAEVLFEDSNNTLDISQNVSSAEIEYETPAPIAIESNTSRGKIILVSSSIHYENVLAYTNLNEEVDADYLGRIKLYHYTSEFICENNSASENISAEINCYYENYSELINFTAYDTNEDDKIDYVEWTIPHMSNQTYEIIIEISAAYHLDSNRELISDIYDRVRARDDAWSENINSGEYVRVIFEKNLTNENDITIYARSSMGAGIEVYENNGTEKIADFGEITNDSKYKIYLTNLSSIIDSSIENDFGIENNSNASFDSYSQGIFDLKIVGLNNSNSSFNSSVQFDYIVDPTIGTTGNINFTSPTPDNATYLSNAYSAMNVSIDSGVNIKNVSWYWGGNGVNLFGENLVLMLNFNNMSGIGDLQNKTVDAVAGINNATCYNMGAWCNYTTGINGKGIYFNGFVGTYANVTGNARLSPQQITISTWIKTTQTSMSLYLKRYLLSGAYPGYCQAFNYGGANVVSVWMGGGAWVTGTKTVNDGSWHNIVSTCNGSQINLYVDGTLDGTYNSALCNVSAPAGETLFIGTYDKTNYMFNGTLDEVRIFNKSFSAAEVQSLYGVNLAKFNSTHYEIFVNKTGFTSSSYDYFASACDINGVCNTTEIRTVLPDVTPPSLTFVSPTPTNNGLSLAGNVPMNLSSNENLSSCTFMWQINSSNVLGDGKDAVLTVTSSRIVNNYTHLATNETSMDNIITVNNSVEFSAGDEILVIQMQNYSNGTAGTYEYRKIVSVTGNNFTLDSNLTNNYSSSKFDSINATSSQVVKIPRYSLVQINAGGAITAKAWDGYSGGIIIFKSQSSVLVKSGGSITATGKGFRGGDGINALNTPGNQGESFVGKGVSSTNNNLGGGGGGRSHHQYWTYRGTGGGAGGYATAGQSGTSAVGSYVPTTNIPGTGGTGYGTANLSLILFGSGGGGTWDGYAYGNRVGGSGGGIIMLFADNITISGSIISSGNVGTSNSDGRMGGAGGGSGGSILLIGNKVSLGTNLSVADGGTGGSGFSNGASDHSGIGGNGSVGRIAILNTTAVLGTASPSVGSYNSTVTNAYSSPMVITNNGGNTTANYTLTNLVAYSNITYSAVCQDLIPNTNSTAPGNFSVVSSVPDTTAPLITIISPLNGNNYSSTRIDFNISSNEALSSCVVTLNDWTTNYTLQLNDSSTGANYTNSSIADGSYLAKFWCNDTSGNPNGTSQVNFTKDTLYPIFSTYWDDNATLNGNGIANFNVTILNSNGTVFLQINNTNYTATNLTLTIYNVSVSLTTGVYSYYWGSWGNGTSHNYNISSTRSYTLNASLDTTAPQINFTSPTPTNGSSQNYNSVYVNVSSNDTSEHSTFADWNRSLVLWMRMDDRNSSGTLVYDNSSYGANGTVNGATYTAVGKRGGAMSFDGVDDYVSMSSVPLTGTGNWTASLWFITTQAKREGVLTFGNGSITSDGAQLYIYTDYKLHFDLAAKGGPSSLNQVNDSRWHYATLVMTGGNATMYLDSIMQSSVANMGTTISEGNTNFIGKDLFGQFNFTGSIDDVMVFNRALSSQEISVLYNASTSQYYNNFTSLNDGSYNYKAYAQDLGGNVNTTEQRMVTIDATKPKINFTSPTPANNTQTTNSSVEINVTIDDANLLGNFSWNWNGTTTSLYDNSLVLMLAMNNNSILGDSGNRTVDTSKYSRNGTCNRMGAGCNYTAGVYGRGIYFNGVNNTINMTNFIGIGGNITFSAWFRLNSLPAGLGYSWSPITAGGGNSPYVSYVLQFDSSTLSWVRIKHGVSNSFDTEYNNNLVTGQWYHMVGTSDGVTASLYLNGNLINSSSVLDNNAGTSGVSAAPDLVIGRGFYTGDSDPRRFLNGTIDEVMIYNRSLSAYEVKQIYMSNLVKLNLTHWEFYANESNLTIRNYTYSATACDLFGNCNSTETRFLSINAVPDTTAPQINFTSPTLANNTQTTNSSVEINVTIDDANLLGNFSWNWNGTNTNLYDNDLVLMLNMDNRSALGENSTRVVDLSKYSNNGTINGAIWNSSGKYGGAYQFDGVDDFINVSSTVSLFPSLVTMSFWMKTSASGNNGIAFVASNQAAASESMEVSMRNGVMFWWFNPGYVSTTISGVNDGTWHHHLLTYNGSETRVYLDGIFRTNSSLVYIPSGGTFLRIGPFTWTGSDYKFNGTLDEFRIYNRSMTATEIQQLYMSNLAKFNSTHWEFYANESNLTIRTYTYSATACDLFGNCNSTETRFLNVLQSDVSAPAVSIVSPTNNSNSTNVNLGINYTVFDLNLRSCWWTNNTGVINYSLTCGANITNQNWKQGITEVLIYANDTVGNTNSSHVKFNIDSVNPLITILSPINITYPNSSISFNISSNEALYSCVVTLNNWANNYSMALNSSNSGAGYINSSIADRSYLAKFWCNDTLGNVNGSSQIAFSKDTAGPFVDIISPLNQSYDSLNITFNVSTNENTSWCGYSLDGNANISMVRFNSTYFWNESTNMTAGLHNVTFSCNDSVNNFGYNSTTFEIANEAAISIDFSENLSSSVRWTLETLPITNLSADGNNGDDGITSYYINISAINTKIDMYMKASGDLFNDGGDILGLGNETYLNSTTTSDSIPGPSTSGVELTTSYAKYVRVAIGGVNYQRFWLDIPASQPAGDYNNSVSFELVQSGQAC